MYTYLNYYINNKIRCTENKIAIFLIIYLILHIVFIFIILLNKNQFIFTLSTIQYIIHVHQLGQVQHHSEWRLQ